MTITSLVVILIISSLIFRSPQRPSTISSSFARHKMLRLNVIITGLTTWGVFGHVVFGMSSKRLFKKKIQLPRCLFYFPHYCIGIIDIAGSDMADETNLVALSCYILLLVQVILQGTFIETAASTDGNNNGRSSSRQRVKPGRQIITFLISANFTLWLMDLTKPKSVDDYSQRDHILVQVSTPLVTVYRFHSVLMLLDIWRNRNK